MKRIIRAEKNPVVRGDRVWIRGAGLNSNRESLAGARVSRIQSPIPPEKTIPLHASGPRNLWSRRRHRRTWRQVATVVTVRHCGSNGNTCGRLNIQRALSHGMTTRAYAMHPKRCGHCSDKRAGNAGQQAIGCDVERRIALHRRSNAGSVSKGIWRRSRMSVDHDLLRAALSASVPIWISELQRKPWPQVIARSEYCVQMICEHGDNVMYRSKRAGDTAKAFNALAEALAMLSFAPGGVTFAGLHFEAQHKGASEQ